MAEFNWGEHKIPGNEPVCFDWGIQKTWCRTYENEIWIATEQVQGDAVDLSSESNQPEETAWSRHVLDGAYEKLALVPRFPDRPVVVQPENPLRLTRKATARIYVRCPLWSRLDLLRGSDSLELMELPLITLSSTWFGQMTEGDLCYWISSGVRRSVEPDTSRPFLVICPIDITNRSMEELSVETICLRVGGLSIYRDGDSLWSNETQIDFLGTDLASEVRYTSNAPREATSATLVTPPRNPLRASIISRSFASLRDLSGMGLFSREE